MACVEEMDLETGQSIPLDAADEIENMEVGRGNRTGLFSEKRNLQGLSCPNCNRMYSEKTRASFERHLENCGKANYRCEDCGKGFVSTVTLRNHLKLHIDILAFQCQICGREFKSKYSLQLHCKVHIDKKERVGDRFKCDYCPKTFAWKASLNRHLQAHYIQGTAAYSCKVCGRKFNKYSEFYIHKKVQCSSAELFSCTVCGRNFDKQSELDYHKKEQCVVSKDKENVNSSKLVIDEIPVTAVAISGKDFASESSQNGLESELGSLQDKKEDITRVPALSHKCQFCDAEFNDRWQLDEHVETCDPFTRVKRNRILSQKEKTGIAKVLAAKMLKCGITKKRTGKHTSIKKKKLLNSRIHKVPMQYAENDEELETVEKVSDDCVEKYRSGAINLDEANADKKKNVASKLKQGGILDKSDIPTLISVNIETESENLDSKIKENETCKIGDDAAGLNRNTTSGKLVKQRISRNIRSAPKFVKEMTIPAHEYIAVEKTLKENIAENLSRSKRKRKLKQFTDFETDFGNQFKKMTDGIETDSKSSDKDAQTRDEIKNAVMSLSDGETSFDGDVEDADFELSEAKRSPSIVRTAKLLKGEAKKEMCGTFSCMYCNRSFTRGYNLNRHQTSCKLKKNKKVKAKVKDLQEVSVLNSQEKGPVESTSIENATKSEAKSLPAAEAVTDEKITSLIDSGKTKIADKSENGDEETETFVEVSNTKAKECRSDDIDAFKSNEKLVKTLVNRKEKENKVSKTKGESGEANQSNVPAESNSADSESSERNQEVNTKSSKRKERRKPKVKTEMVERFSRLPFSSNCLSENYKDEKVTHAIYKCTTANCNSIFSWKKSLANHKLSVHFEKFVYLCSQCQKTFSSENVLKSHIRMAHSKMKTVLLSIVNTEILKPGDNQEKYDIFICVQCGYTFTEDNSDSPHDCAPYQLRFLCPYCENCFQNFQDAQEHIKKEHPDDVLNEQPDERYMSMKSTVREASLRVGDMATKCDTCDEVFETNDQLKQHINLKHANFPFCCGVCRFSFGRTSAIIRHLLVHRKSTFCCSYCSKGFYDKSCLERHLRIHTGERPCQCDICGNGYCDDKAVRKHMKFKHPEAFKQQYKDTLAARNMLGEGEGRVCDVCGDSFDSVSKLEFHLLTHRSDWHLRCNHCNKVFLKKREFEQHKLKHLTENLPNGKLGKVNKLLNVSGTAEARKSFQDVKIVDHTHLSGKPLQCGLCNKRFRRTSLLNYHIQAMHLKEDDKNYVCKFCNRGFCRQFMLDNHMRVHTDNRPFKCRLCSKTFKQLAHVRDHLRAHGKSMFPCKICSKSFKTRGTLSAHVITHCKILPFKCPKTTCQSSCRDLKQLITHFTRCYSSEETSKEPYKCNVCQQESFQSGDMLLHLYTHDKDELYSCQTCSLKFHSYRSLYFHKADKGHFLESEVGKQTPKVLNIHEKSQAVVEEVEWRWGIEDLMSQYDYIREEADKDASGEHLEKVKEYDAETEPVNESTSYMNESDELFLIAEQLTYMAAGTDHYKEVIVPGKSSENEQNMTDMVSAGNMPQENTFEYAPNSISENLGYPTVIIRNGNVHYANSDVNYKFPHTEKAKDFSQRGHYKSEASEISKPFTDAADAVVVTGSVTQSENSENATEVTVWTADSYDTPAKVETDLGYQALVEEDGVVEPFQFDVYTTYDNEEITETLDQETSQKLDQDYNTTEDDQLNQQRNQNFSDYIVIKRYDEGDESSNSDRNNKGTEVNITNEVKEIKDKDLNETYENLTISDAVENSPAQVLIQDIPLSIRLSSDSNPAYESDQTIKTEETESANMMDATATQHQVKVLDHLGNEVIVCVINEKGEQEQITDSEEVLRSVMQTGRYTIQNRYQHIETADTSLDDHFTDNLDQRNPTIKEEQTKGNNKAEFKVTNVVIVKESLEGNEATVKESPAKFTTAKLIKVNTKNSNKSVNKMVTNTKKILGKLNLEMNKSVYEDKQMQESDDLDIRISLNYYEDRPDNENPHKCENCPRRFASIKNLNFHKKTHLPNKDRKFQCMTCGAGFHVPKALEVHMRIHTGDKPYVCKHCKKEFRQRGHLQLHLRIHANYYPFECNFCGKKYASNSNLTRHIKRNHLDEGNGDDFPCNICDKQFKSSGCLRAHQLYHLPAKAQREFISMCNDVKPIEGDNSKDLANEVDECLKKEKPAYICDACGLVLRTISSLKLHRMRHESGSDFKCTECGKGYPTEDLLNDHTKQHFKESTPCEYCGKQFKNKSNLRSHLFKYHRTESVLSDKLKFQCRKCKKSMSLKQRFVAHVTACMKEELQAKLAESWQLFQKV